MLQGLCENKVILRLLYQDALICNLLVLLKVGYGLGCHSLSYGIAVIGGVFVIGLLLIILLLFFILKGLISVDYFEHGWENVLENI